MKRVVLLIYSALLAFPGYAQIFGASQHLEELFRLDVSTMSEFRTRFNFEQEEYASNKERTLLSLFDRSSEAVINNEAVVISFVQDVLSSGRRLSLKDSLWFAELECSIQYKKRSYPIRLILKTEEIDPEMGACRWALCGVNGLRENGLILPHAMAEVDAIDNDMLFLGLESRLESDYKNAFGYRSVTSKVDQLSIFLYMLQESLWKVEGFGSLKYHFLSVPGYLFVVEHSKTPRNSGWLISDIAEITEEQKSAYEKVYLAIN